MNQKDISEKIIEYYNDVFADIVNVLLFDGERLVRPDKLEDGTARSAYKADGKLREIERDVLKRWTKGDFRLAYVGIENQTSSDPDMSLRVIAYDGAQYRAQLSRKGERYPVITLVLHFDYHKKWNQATSLFETLDIKKELKPFVNDYKINLFEVAFLPRKQVDLFQSDFWYVADYFAQMQESGNYVPTAKNVKHIQEVLSLLSIMTDDRRFEDAYESARSEGKEMGNMCEFLDKIENQGIAKGRIEGMIEGRMEGELQKSKDIAYNLHKNGVDDAVIALSIGISEEELHQWYEAQAV